MTGTLSLILTFAVSAGIGLLVGLERERKPTAKAGVRTFTLIALLGSLAALLTDATGSAWALGAGAVAVTGTLVAAYLQDPESVRDDSGTTTVVAALAVYFLGAINYYGYRIPAVALGVGITVLLYFKAEIEGFSQKLTGQDVRSMLQFAVLTAVILPLLPDRSFGPYGVLNPFQVWLMVVLVAAVSLSGYVAWRLTLGRHGLLLTGVLGGLVSSTATTLGYARQVAAGSQSMPAAVLVILLANATMLVRVLFLVGVVAPAVLPQALVALVPALLVALGGVAWRWKAVDTIPANGEEAFRNPTQLGTAIGFGAVYALVLLFSAWANDAFGVGGVLALAAASGLTDVDAITLSSMQMLDREALSRDMALTAVTTAIGSNLVFKMVTASTAGGPALRGPIVRAFGAVLLGLAGGLAAMHALA
ncbi:MAG TPA: MgtC/SapB family protein [Burkholderiaceae bacterium]|nr:MgtC/SapB family protein [Burkholderiaceae bacterium]